jgi:hypothetical protein
MCRYTGATLKCPVLGRFRLTMAERGWTRQNGPAIAVTIPAVRHLGCLAEKKRVVISDTLAPSNLHQLVY